MAERCTAQTQAGRQCLSYAARGSIARWGRPLCSTHSRMHARQMLSSAPPPAARTTGEEAERTLLLESLYRTYENAHVATGDDQEATLAHEIALIRGVIGQLLAFLESCPDQSIDDLAELVRLTFTGARTVAGLLRDQRALSGEAADSVVGALGLALDELSRIWGVEL